MKNSDSKEDFLSGLKPKVGILFNAPIQPTRGEDIDYVAEAEVEDQVNAVQDALRKLDFQHQTFPLERDVEELIKAVRSYRPDVVINLCEGAFGDSHLLMNVPSILELLGISYTGSPPLALGLCENKGMTKDILRANGITTPEYQVLNCFEEWRGEINYPLFVKPLREGASLGVSRRSYVTDNNELRSQVEYITKCYRQPALIEEYIDGREFNIALLGNERIEVLPISEILFGFKEEPKIVDYSAKWLKKSENYRKTTPVCPAEVRPFIEDELKKVSLRAYELLCCRDYARVDIRLKKEVPYVLEVNPNPDISPEAGFTRSLKAACIPFKNFVERIVSFALERKYS